MMTNITEDVEIHSFWPRDEQHMQLTVLAKPGHSMDTGSIQKICVTLAAADCFPEVQTTYEYTLMVLSCISATTDDHRQSSIVECKILACIQKNDSVIKPH